MNSKRKDGVLIGLILVIYGVISIFSACGVDIAAYIKGWWTLFLIVPGVYIFVAHKNYFWGTLLAAAGVVFFLSERAIIAATLPVPILLTVVGILILVLPREDKKNKSKKDKDKDARTFSGDIESF